MEKKTLYIVITPVRDEEKHIGETIKSMVSQTVLPAQWIIVDDGSTDSTGGIIDAAAKQYSWIKTVHRANRGFRKNGGGVIEAFYDGYNVLNCMDFDFIIKLDGDLSLQSDYFERCFEKFRKNPRLGIGGGTITSMCECKNIVEGCPCFHVRGATKIYRKACWNDIGHLIKAPGWDTLDEVKANMKGWSTESFQDLGLVQHKMTGSADGSWNNWVKNGLANYISGYHPLFMLLKCIKRLPNKPRGIAAAGLFWGFCLGYVKRMPHVDDPDLIAYLRKEQVKKLLLRKSIWQ